MKLLVVALLLSTSPAIAVTIPTVPVGNAGNANDPLTGLGAMAYEYRIGATEVTNTQYAEFLNAKAASDPLGLYTAETDIEGRGGIIQNGVSGGFTYATKSDMGNMPVNYLDWFDAIRFANWLNNGQGNGDTETGAYTLLGGTPIPSNALSITRNSDATWFLPSEGEWYKAAYHQPAAYGGDSDDYWLYPTKSNSLPTKATADSVGVISNPGSNVANHSNLLGSPDFREMAVGSAGPLSESFYGTSDQGGNVVEWNETLIRSFFRGNFRGGSFYDNGNWLKSTFQPSYFFPDAEVGGFRVATIPVPEPSTYALSALGAIALLAFRRRTR